MGSNTKKIIFLLIGFLVSGCSVDASILGKRQAPSLKLMEAKTTGLIPGSSQTGTAGQYRVQSSVGSYISGIEQKTTDGSYQIYSSVQGTLLSR